MAKRKAFGLKITLSAGLILVSSVMVLAVMSAGGSSSGNFNNTAKVATTAASDQQTLAQPASVISTPQCPTGYTLSNGLCRKTDTHTPFCTAGFDLIITPPPPVLTTKCRKIYDAVWITGPGPSRFTCPDGGSLVSTKCFLFETPRCYISYTLSDSENTCSRTFTSTPTCDGGFILSGSTCRAPANATECNSLNTGNSIGYHWIRLSSGQYACRNDSDARTICYRDHGVLTRNSTSKITSCTPCPAGQVVDTSAISCGNANTEAKCDRLDGYVWGSFNNGQQAAFDCVTDAFCNSQTNYSVSGDDCVYTAPTSCPAGQVRVNGSCRAPTTPTECDSLNTGNSTGYHWIKVSGDSQFSVFGCRDDTSARAICYRDHGVLTRNSTSKITSCTPCPAGQVVDTSAISCGNANTEAKCDRLDGYVWGSFNNGQQAAFDCVTDAFCNSQTNYSVSGDDCVYTAPTSCPAGQVRVNGSCRAPANATECDSLNTGNSIGYHWIRLSSGQYACRNDSDARTICYRDHGVLTRNSTSKITSCTPCPAGQVVDTSAISCGNANTEAKCDRLDGYVWGSFNNGQQAAFDCVTDAFCNSQTNYSVSGDDCVYTAPTSCPAGQVRVNGSCRAPANATECDSLNTGNSIGYHWIRLSSGQYACRNDSDARTICYRDHGVLTRNSTSKITSCTPCPAGQVVDTSAISCGNANTEAKCDRLDGYVWGSFNNGQQAAFDCVTDAFCNSQTNYSVSGDDCVYTAPTSCPAGQVRVNGSCRAPANAS